MKKGIIICITAGLAAFALTFLGLTMVNQMAARELESKSVEEVKEESAPVKQVVTTKPSYWPQETKEIVVEADPPLLSRELEQEEAEEDALPQEKLPAIALDPDYAEINVSTSVCEFVKMLKVKDQVYMSTDTVVNVLRCGVMDGEIDSTVANGVIPEQNNQSNFGTGFGYQIISADVVDVYIDGEWIMFTPVDRQVYIERDLETEEVMEEEVTEAEVTPLLTVTSDKYTANAYEMFASSMTWNEHGWLCACGLDPATSLPQVAGELPEFTLTEDFSVNIKENAALQEIVIYDKNFQKLQRGASLADIQALQYGKYYICYEILEQGAYIASEGKYETTEYGCIFGLIVSAVNQKVG
jgi:hypothetical protein